MLTEAFTMKPRPDGQPPGLLLAFDARNRALLRRLAETEGEGAQWAATEEWEEGQEPGKEAYFQFWAGEGEGRRAVYFAKWEGARAGAFNAAGEGAGTPGETRELVALEDVYRAGEAGSGMGLSAALREALPGLRAHAMVVPYLGFGRHDFVYKFRSERERNGSVYSRDEAGRALYLSRLCEAVKAARRVKENAAGEPALLDFGAVRYVLPSHFGFCLGVQNAIERAYETLARHPGERVFMMSELIHNPFVNEDLQARGLKYLQTDKGKPLVNGETGRTYWEELRGEDVVIIPAFGATDADKIRLIEKGLPLNEYDATCMLVEKVWKAAKRFGEAGYTVIIHGKAEHEETKATFSNSSRYAPSLVVRNREAAETLATILRETDAEKRRALFAGAGLTHSEGFDAGRHLDRVAVVNQTTLLRNETLAIIDLMEAAMGARFGPEEARERVNGKSRGDTLCYATQVNQDALQRALEWPCTAALVAGGKNSSNTFQLYRLCARAYGERAHYIQSERNLLSRGEIEHFVFPYDLRLGQEGRLERKPFLPEKTEGPARILLTGGASCPDGILQRIIERINGFFDPAELRPVEAVLEEMEESAAVATA